MYFRNLFAKANTRKTSRVHKTKKEQETAWEYKDTRLYTAVKQGTQRMTAVFCGVTNCPITSILIAFEMFGFKGVPFYLIAVSISYAASGYYGLYKDQTIVYSKYKAKYVNKPTRF